MIRTVAKRVWAFDLEWVPDPLAGRLLYDIPEDVDDPREILQEMWDQGGASETDPTPFLKLAICRVVSIAAVERRVQANGEVALHLLSLPRHPEDQAEAGEARLISTFLDAIGKHRPQLVGFSSSHADLRILIQRGLVLGLQAPGFCQPPARSSDGADYFARATDWHHDLREIVGGWGKGAPSLHQLAVQSGIPGKMGVDGNQVAELWLAGELSRIVQYNEADALTTYLVWLRLAHLAGLFTGDQYQREQDQLRNMLERESQEPDKEHLGAYLQEWQRLQEIVRQGRG
jgi:predicted PolB exonuclease-like 3'-5' exonuclease